MPVAVQALLLVSDVALTMDVQDLFTLKISATKKS